MRRGLTQQQLAALSGIDQASINRIERSQRWPTLAQLSRLAKNLQVSFQWLMSGTHWPGSELRDLAIELQHWGIVDLWVPDARVPGAFRPREEVVALALSGNEPDPRIVEALPAVLAWNQWNVRLLRAYSETYEKRTLYRLAWLADVALTIDKHFGFPRGCPAGIQLARFINGIKPFKDRERSKARPQLDALGRPAGDGRLHPVWKRWRINYAADLDTFRNRAAHLTTLSDGNPTS